MGAAIIAAPFIKEIKVALPAAWAYSLCLAVAVFAAIASLLLVLPIIVKSLRRMILPSSVTLMLIAGGEAGFMLVRGQTSVAMARGVLFAMALVLCLIRWRITPMNIPTRG